VLDCLARERFSSDAEGPYRCGMTDHRRDMRAADADREQVVRRLRKAADEGRLRVEEFDDRLGQALNARTYGQLDALVGDLPPGRALMRRPARVKAHLLRRSRLVRHTGRMRIMLRSPRRALVAGALATAAIAAPLTVIEVGASRPSVRIAHVGARNGNGYARYDWREENNPNAPHPPVYYVLKANQGEK
jgi:hypothetical protein